MRFFPGGLFIAMTTLLLAFNNCGGFKTLGGENSSSATATQVFSFNPASLNVNNSTSDFQALIQSAVASRAPARIELAAQTYRLECNDARGSFCLTISDAADLAIVGVPGKTKLLVSAPAAGIFNIVRSKNISISGITIDYERLPFTQGRVTNVAGLGFDLTIDDGFEEPDASQFATFLFDGSGKGTIFNAADLVKHESIDAYVALSTQKATRNSGRNWHFTAYNGNLSALIAAGDHLALSITGSQGIQSMSSTNLSLENIRYLASPYMGVVTVGNMGTTTVRAVSFEPGAGRLQSVNADAVHVLDSRARLLLQNSSFRHQGDDALNVTASANKILAVSGAFVAIAKPGVDFAVGDQLQFTSPLGDMATRPAVVGRLSGYPVITAMNVAGNVLNIALDRSVAGSVANGDNLFNLNLASPSSVVDGNTFYDFRGGTRFRSVSGSFTNNTFQDARFAKVLLSVDSYWPEGPWAMPLLNFGGNVVNGGSLQWFGDNWAPFQPTAVIAIPAPTPVSNPVAVANPVSSTSAPTPASPVLHAIYRYRSLDSADHVYSLSANQGSARLINEGVAFQLADSISNSIALYRCYSGREHFISTLAACEGAQNEGLLGYGSVTQISATSALYRLYNPSTQLHLSTAHLTEKSAAQNSEGVQAWVW